jgi:pyruvate kinase
VEIAREQVPVIQKRLIRETRLAGKPVITATQMLESMTHNPSPTRAEASDVANAIFDGTDAIMLSAETATGNYPVESVAVMKRIANIVEVSQDFRSVLDSVRPAPLPTIQDAIARAACEVAEALRCRNIVVFTQSGSSVRRIVRNRPVSRIIALTPNAKVRLQLNLAFGVYPVQVPIIKNTDEMVDLALQIVRDHEQIRSGDRIVIAAGVPFGSSGTTNLVRVEEV